MFFCSSIRRHTRCALVTGVQTCALPILWVDPFREPRMWTLEALEALAERGQRGLDACLLPIEAGMAAWPEARVDALQARRLGQGHGVEGRFRPEGEVAIVAAGGRVVGLGLVDGEGVPRPTTGRAAGWERAGQEVEI